METAELSGARADTASVVAAPVRQDPDGLTHLAGTWKYAPFIAELDPYLPST